MLDHSVRYEWRSRHHPTLCDVKWNDIWDNYINGFVLSVDESLNVYSDTVNSGVDLLKRYHYLLIEDHYLYINEIMTIRWKVVKS